MRHVVLFVGSNPSWLKVWLGLRAALNIGNKFVIEEVEVTALAFFTQIWHILAKIFKFHRRSRKSEFRTDKNANPGQLVGKKWSATVPWRSLVFKQTQKNDAEKTIKTRRVSWQLLGFGFGNELKLKHSRLSRWRLGFKPRHDQRVFQFWKNN